MKVRSYSGLKQALRSWVYLRGLQIAMAVVLPESFGSAEAAIWLKEAVQPGGLLRKEFEGLVKDIIGAELREGGGAKSAVEEVVKAELLPLSVGLGATDSKLDALEPRLVELEPKVGQLVRDCDIMAARVQCLEKVEKDLDKAFPWRQFERDCDPQEWLLSWKRMMVNRDWMANIADQMGDPAVANAMAALLANPNHPEAAKLKAVVSLRKAPKTSWKALSNRLRI